MEAFTVHYLQPVAATVENNVSLTIVIRANLGG